MQQWAETKHQRPRNSTKGSSFASSIRSDSRFSDDSTQVENKPIFPVPASSARAALLRSFYTIWYIGRISQKPLKTSNEASFLKILLIDKLKNTSGHHDHCVLIAADVSVVPWVASQLDCDSS